MNDILHRKHYVTDEHFCIIIFLHFFENIAYNSNPGEPENQNTASAENKNHNVANRLIERKKKIDTFIDDKNHCCGNWQQHVLIFLNTFFPLNKYIFMAA